MSGDKRALLKQRLESGEIRLQPLSFPQRELWETSPVPVTDMANHICCLIEVRGKVTPIHVTAAIHLVVQRQEALRVSFVPGKERPLQMIRREGIPNVRFRKLSPEQSTPEAIEAIASEVFSEPFDLLQGPLYRVKMLSKAEDDHLLVFAIHHAIADGWTLGVFVQELCIAYIQEVRGIKEELPPVALSYTDWGANERALWQPAELEPRTDFWKQQLAGYQRIWGTLEGPDTASGAHQRIVTHFPKSVAVAVKELARQSSTTLFSTLLTAFQVALSRWAGVDDILVGAPVANRTRQAMNETMGYFAGIVPIRGRVEPARPFSESLRTMHQTTVDCFANAMPFAELAKALNDPGTPGHNPIFEVRFALQNHPVPDVDLPGMSAKLRMRSTGTARYHLACEITEEEEQLEVVWLFRPKLFGQTKIEALKDLFQNVLIAACRYPETKIADLACEPS